MARGANLALLLLAASLSLSCSIYLGGSSRDGRETRQFIKRHKSVPIRLSAGLKDKLSGTKPFSYPSSHLGVRQRRSDDSEDEKCGLSSSVVLETDPVSPVITSPGQSHCSCLCVCVCV